MKRIFAFALLTCLLLSGCKTAVAPAGSASTPEQPQPSTSEPSPAVSTEPEAEQATVYLLDKTTRYNEAGGVMDTIEHYYDEAYNIDTYKVLSPTNELDETVYFEEKDANGMAGKCRSDWGDGFGKTNTLLWHEDGKLKEVQYDTAFYGAVRGLRYVYAPSGMPSQKQEFYEESVDSVLHYEYDGDMLQRAYCMNWDEHMTFEYRCEDGRVVERICYTEEGSKACTHDFSYDENGNLVQETTHEDGKTAPTKAYTYKAVQVDATRVPYLVEQQNYLLSIE